MSMYLGAHKHLVRYLKSPSCPLKEKSCRSYHELTVLGINMSLCTDWAAKFLTPVFLFLPLPLFLCTSLSSDGLNAENNDDRVLQCCLQYQTLYPECALILCT